MLNIAKYYVYDESRNPIAVQISINDFEKLEELFENYGLSQLIDETSSDKCFKGQSALTYYESLKNEMAS